jgi:hypothetical protein
LIQQTPSSQIDFHGTWIDSEGGVWAVGGDLNNLNSGVLQYAGSGTISSTIAPLCPLGATGGGTVSWANDVMPLLQQTHCLDAGCHGPPPAFAASGYLMNTYASAFNQGVEANALGVCPIVPGDTDSSYLLEKLLPNPRPTGSKQMPPPPTPPLTDDQMNTIRTWVMEGARNN